VPGAIATFAWGINTAGAVTLQWYDSKSYLESALYNGKKYTTINVPGAFFTGVHSINTAADIVFSWQDPSGNTHGALKEGSAYFIFDYPNGSNTGSEGINDSSLLVGHYTLHTGRQNPPAALQRHGVGQLGRDNLTLGRCPVSRRFCETGKPAQLKRPRLRSRPFSVEPSA